VTRAGLAISGAVVVFSVLAVVSMVASGIVFPTMHIGRSDSATLAAVVGTGLLILFVPAFARARFSFGYILSFWLYSAVVGFVWLSFFSEFDYPHTMARWSMVAALAAALAPLMFLNVPLPRLTISKAIWHRLTIIFLIASLSVLAADAAYGVAFASPYSDDRNLVTRPTALNYLTGITIGAVLPYLFAYFASRKRWALAIGSLAIALFYYPIVVNKTALLLPLWLPFLFWLFGRSEPRIATVLSLLIPLAIGLLDLTSYFLFLNNNYYLFSLINLRLIAVPSLALDHYADFFARHDITHFCQMTIVRKLFGCAYDELGPTMASVYHDGNFNASFLATEGIASVGLTLAPLSALVCGFVLSLGSSAARHLSPRFIAVSSGIAVQALMNIPLTTAMISNGIFVLFLLWWMTPKEMSGPPRIAGAKIQLDTRSHDRGVL
jgi:hypothetical protein